MLYQNLNTEGLFLLAICSIVILLFVIMLISALASMLAEYRIEIESRRKSVPIKALYESQAAQKSIA
jgi:hypothetical protein